MMEKERYKKEDYIRPYISVDPVLFRVVENDVGKNKLKEKKLQVLLIERPKEPFTGLLSLPGGVAKDGESLEKTVIRKLQEKTGIKENEVVLNPFGVFSEPDRDPRNHVISVSYYAVIPEDIVIELGENAKWVNVEDVESGLFQIAFDHKKIIETAKAKVIDLLWKTPIAVQFLKSKFTLGELHNIFVAFGLKDIAISNFHRDYKKSQFIVQTDEKEENVYRRNKGVYYVLTEKGKTELEKMSGREIF